jgi:hypothetical protein
MSYKTTCYEIITAQDASKLAARIQSLLIDGFQLYGDPFYFPPTAQGSMNHNWAQAIIKTEYQPRRQS